jgi:hypothetical protein
MHPPLKKNPTPMMNLQMINQENIRLMTIMYQVQLVTTAVKLQVHIGCAVALSMVAILNYVRSPCTMHQQSQITLDCNSRNMINDNIQQHSTSNNSKDDVSPAALLLNFSNNSNRSPNCNKIKQPSPKVVRCTTTVVR